MSFVQEKERNDGWIQSKSRRIPVANPGTLSCNHIAILGRHYSIQCLIKGQVHPKMKNFISGSVWDSEVLGELPPQWGTLTKT